MAAQHLEDHVLRAHPFGQSPGEADAPDPGHLQVERFAGHRERHLDPPGANGEHAERAGRRRVAVGADQQRTGPAEALHVHRMADPVARAAVPDAEAATRAAQELLRDAHRDCATDSGSG